MTEHGTRIALDYAFTTPIEPLVPDAGPSAGPVPTVPAPGARQAAVTGLGLLRWLWEAAGLNTWPPPSPARTNGPSRPCPAAAGPRGRWDDTRAALSTVLAGVRLGEHPAPRLVYVVAPWSLHAHQIHAWWERHRRHREPDRPAPTSPDPEPGERR